MNIKKFRTLKLVIIFIIILVIGILAIKHISKLMNEKKVDDIKTNMLTIKGRITLIKGESEVKQNEENFVGEKVSDSNNQDIKNLMKSINIAEDQFENYFILKKEDFEKMNIIEEIKNIEDNVYIVNYNEAEVVYTKGIEIDNKIKYKLSDIIIKQPEKKWILYNRIKLENILN